MAIDLPVAMISATVELEQPQPDRGNVRVVGTGFLVNAPRPDGSPRTVLVTASHVFEEMPGQNAYIGYRFKGPDGTWKFASQPLQIRDGPNLLWLKNPSQDVAVMSIKAPPEFARAAIPIAWLADESSFAPDAIEPGDEMFVLGFPQGYSANPSGFPILRGAHISSYPVVAGDSYPLFMLDMRVFDGNSGGPVFLANPDARRPGAPVTGTPYLTGLVASAAAKIESAFVIEAPVIRRTIALLDQPAAPAAVSQAQPAASQR
jgi:S1-C subfamily serine protease